jgi:hypothetical protein|tara:strand:+ start:2143 stop:2298 length:156 start_codon:yes stop_codon:yes gene_type:complete
MKAFGSSTQMQTGSKEGREKNTTHTMLSAQEMRILQMQLNTQGVIFMNLGI